jgi:hypothetical protein
MKEVFGVCVLELSDTNEERTHKRLHYELWAECGRAIWMIGHWTGWNDHYCPSDAVPRY